MSHPACLPAERPAILAFRGPDAARYLNGQLTQDVADLGDAAKPSCVTDAKGRLQFRVKICNAPEDDALWLYLPESRAEGLRERLERYLIADDVEIEDLTGRWTVIHAESAEEHATFSRRANGPFGEGFDLWWPAGDEPDWSPIPAEEIEAREIERGLPAWDAELKPGMLPPEAGLDRTDVSLAKGCFIGQEVLSRLKSIGQVTRRLATFEVDAAAAADDPLTFEGKQVGSLTRVSPRPGDNGARPALGFLKKKAYEAGTFVIGAPDAEPKGAARRTGWA